MSARPSWQHRLLAGLVLPLAGVRRRNALLRLPELLAAEQERSEPRLDRRHLAGLRVTRTQHRGWPVWCFQPPAAPLDGPVVVLVPGGNHVSSPSPRHVRLSADLARSARARVVLPLRPPAPAATADAVVPATAALVRAEVERRPGARVTVVAEGAGGGLALAALQSLAASGRPQPDHLVLVSPWLDASVPASRDERRRDPVLDRDQLRECGRLWAGALPVDDPRVSPLHGCLRGLPRTTVFAGTRDLLHRDSVRLAERALELGVPLELDLRDGLVHGWALRTGTPEGAAATARITDLVTGRERVPARRR